MVNRYKKIVKADQKNVDGGYKNVVLWAPRSSFTTIAMPAPGVTPASGDSLRIVTSHIFGTDDGFISWLCKQHSVTLKGKSEGEAGAKSMVWTSEFVLLGDSASTQEQLEDQLNDDVVLLLKDGNCLLATDYVQIGDDCNNPEFDVEFDGKTTASGLKEYKVTMKCKKGKYFYSGTVTEKPVIDTSLVCPVYTLNSTNNKISVILAGMGTANHFITKLYSDAAGTNLLQTHTLGGTVTADEFVGLTATTQYYVRVIPVAADGTQLTTCTLQGQATV